MGPEPNRLPGVTLCLIAIFLPSLLLGIGALPFWDELGRRPAAQSILRGVNAAVDFFHFRSVLAFKCKLVALRNNP